MRIIIVEDQAMLRESLTCAVNAHHDAEVVGSFADAADAVEAASRLLPDLVLMDVCTENDSSGIVAARKIKKAHPEIRIVVMTGMPDVTFVKQAREAGADSFVYKNIGTSELLGVLRSTMEGYSTFPQKQTGEFSGAMSLSEEEIAILRLVCETKTRKEIAAELLLSEGTVKRRISEILAKTGYESILKLAVHVVSNGYIVPRIEGERQESA